MSIDALVKGIILIIVLGVVVFIVETFLPVNANIEFKAECRKALLQMENSGGLTTEIEQELYNALLARGFDNIQINGTSIAKFAEKINLQVEVEYEYSTITSLFIRQVKVQPMRYDKTSVSRMVIK